MKLYTMPGSLHCQEAEKLLKEAKVPFEKIELIGEEILNAVPRDLGFHRLPVLLGKDVYCEGLKEIAIFISNWKKNKKSKGDRLAKTKR